MQFQYINIERMKSGALFLIRNKQTHCIFYFILFHSSFYYTDFFVCFITHSRCLFVLYQIYNASNTHWSQSSAMTMNEIDIVNIESQKKMQQQQRSEKEEELIIRSNVLFSLLPLHSFRFYCDRMHRTTDEKKTIHAMVLPNKLH